MIPQLEKLEDRCAPAVVSLPAVETTLGPRGTADLVAQASLFAQAVVTKLQQLEFLGIVVTIELAALVQQGGRCGTTIQPAK